MDQHSTPTRRQLLKTSVVLVGAGAAAGCVGSEDEGNGSGNGDTGDGDNGSGNGDAGNGGNSETDENGTDDNGMENGDNGMENGDDNEMEDGSDGESGDGSYTVTMEPVGTVEFDAVPEAWAANNGSWADMGIALGRAPPEAVYLAGRYHTKLYDEIPGVSVDGDAVESLWTSKLDPEQFLALGEEVDVLVMDPNFLVGRSDGIDENDIDRIESAGTPFFGNSSFSRGYEWHDYEYLSLYEAFEHMAELFQERERYKAFAALHEEFQANVADIVPPAGERPSVTIMWPQPAEAPEAFSPYLIDEGTSFKQWRDLGVEDAFATTDVEDFHAGRARIDYELLLQIDPDVLLIRGNEAKTAAEFRDTVLSFMESHNVASELTAVGNGDVYRGGPLYQGPITNMVLTERAASQVYGVEEELFDRQRVADIVNGEF